MDQSNYFLRFWLDKYDEGTELMYMYLHSVDIRVGEIINLAQTTQWPEAWRDDIVWFHGKYKVKEVHKHYENRYGPSGIHSITQTVFVEVVVEKYEK